MDLCTVMWTRLAIFLGSNSKGSFGVERYFEDLWTTLAEKTDTKYVLIFYDNKYFYPTKNIEIQSNREPKIK